MVTEDFVLSFENPCVLTSFVQLEAPTFIAQDYFIFTSAKDFVHPVFTFTSGSNADAVTLCGAGGITYVGTYHNAPTTTSSTPVLYDPNEREYSIFIVEPAT